MIKDSGNRTEFSTGAVRDCKRGVGRMDLLPWYGILEVSKHCEEGALKYGEHNVDKGIPLHSLLDSASRHLAKYMVGMDDEDHLRAACWNLLWALNQRVTHPELDDRFCVAESTNHDNDTGEEVHCYCGKALAKVTSRGLKLCYPEKVRFDATGAAFLRCPDCDQEIMVLHPVWDEMGGIIV